jgi:hypothetical protein
MKKYILMVVGIVGLSVIGFAGVAYSLIASAPMEISRQERAPQVIETPPQLAQSGGKILFSAQ